MMFYCLKKIFINQVNLLKEIECIERKLMSRGLFYGVQFVALTCLFLFCIRINYIVKRDCMRYQYEGLSDGYEDPTAWSTGSQPPRSPGGGYPYREDVIKYPLADSIHYNYLLLLHRKIIPKK